MKKLILKISLFTLFCIISLGSFQSFAQNDSIPENNEVKKEKKKKDEFKILAGVTFNSLSGSSDEYDLSDGVGYIIGVKYKRGRFFYWELGARYNASIYALRENESTEDNLSINSIDVPINVGINLLSVTDRILGLRLYVGAIPTFTTKISDNTIISKDDVNSFRMYGQAGVGLDVAFFFLETGLNYGFTDVLKNEDFNSNQTQIFINIGFRF